MKSKIKALKSSIEKNKRELEKTTEKEFRSRKKWTAEYGKFMTSAEDLTKVKIHGTAKETKLKRKVLDWPKRSVDLTAERNIHRIKIEGIKNDLMNLGLELVRLTEQECSQANATNEIVMQVFALNDVAVRAAIDREECLKRHVFPRLIGENGKLSSQVSFTTSDGLRRVIAMVNTMTVVLGDLANKAQDEIQKFFDKFQKTKMDSITEAMYELTKQILVEKTNFKVGPDLYRFLGMELDEDIFPELALAQRYLRQSIRSEKTNSYIRLYRRKSMSDKWEVVPQS